MCFLMENELVVLVAEFLCQQNGHYLCSFLHPYFKFCSLNAFKLLQNLGDTGLPFFVTLNPDYTPEHTLVKWTTSHIIPSVAARNASLEFEHIQGKRGLWFCGAYQGKPSGIYKRNHQC